MQFSEFYTRFLVFIVLFGCSLLSICVYVCAVLCAPQIFAPVAPEIVNIKIIRSKDTFVPQGYGFVEFRSRDAAEHVLKHYDGQPVPSNPFSVACCSLHLSSILEKFYLELIDPFVLF